jgi:ATP-dependent Clp protease ATP-binding subunit ClpX
VTQICNFCGRPRNEVKNLIQGSVADSPSICNRCIDTASKALVEGAKGPSNKKEEPLRKPKEILAFLDSYVIGQEKAKTDIAVAVYNHYKRRLALQKGLAPEVEIEKSNVIFRAVARMLKVPFYVADATRLTQAGYVGDDVESMLQGLVADAEGDIERAEWGIVFIDEFDKLARKSGMSVSGYRDVTGEGVQQAMLKLLEGARVNVPRGLGAKVVMAGAGGADMIDTSNILFIGAGSFAGIEDIVGKRVNKGVRVGFQDQTEHRKKLTKSDTYSAMIEEDILEFGLIPELVGRMPILTTTLELSEDEMVRILTEPKNAVIKQFQALFAMDNVELLFDEAALRVIGKEAKKRPTGARALRSIVEGVLKPYAFEVPSDPSIQTVVVTEECVLGFGKATVVRRQEAIVA